MSHTEWRDAMAVNLEVTFLCWQSAARYVLVGGSGSIENASSETMPRPLLKFGGDHSWFRLLPDRTRELCHSLG